MKISIGVNGYKPEIDLLVREHLCLEALRKIKTTNTQINLYNVIFEDENITYTGFTTLNLLKKKSNKIIKKYFKDGLPKDCPHTIESINNNDVELPIIKEIFDTLANTDCDYFVFLNNDIILSNRLLKEIKDSYDSYCVSRVNINEISSLQETPQILEYCVHGFDAFVIKKSLWLKIRNHFDDFVLGRFYWDTYTATVLNLLTKCKNLNKQPPVCFHVDHKNVSAQKSIENYYCEHIFKQNNIISYFWFTYVYNVLFKRTSKDNCKWYYPLNNEESIESQFFKQFEKLNVTVVNNYTKYNVEPGEKEYDIFIPVAPKDENKLAYVLEGALTNLNSKNIFICSPHNIKNKILNSNITYINDADVLDIDNRTFITFRPNWTYQQFLKLSFQGPSDYFFALDSDTVIIDKLNLFDNKHPVWFYGEKQNHFPYFLFNKVAFDLYKSLNHTGIGDVGFFNKKIIQTLFNRVNFKQKDFLLEIGNKLTNIFHFSEYETYANFVNEFYPNLYCFKQLNKISTGKNLDSNENWTNTEIVNAIKNAKNNNKQIITLHSWKI